MSVAVFDVAIVGGGIAGLYTAWRLAMESARRVIVFEAGMEPGGRLRTVAFPAPAVPPVELGGIGYRPSHGRVAALVDRLGLPVQPCDNRPGDGFLALRGRTLRRSAVRTHHLGRLFPFAVSRRQQTRGQARLLLEAAERLVPGAAQLDRAGWQALREAGSPLADRPAEAALAETLGIELVRYIEARAGLTIYTRQPSALHALEWLVPACRLGTDLLAPVGGYQRLPRALAAALERCGSRVETGCSVIGVRQDGGDGPVALRIRDRSGREAAVTAGRVVLAMGRRGIEAISDFPARDAAGSPMARLLRQVEPHGMGRLALAYPARWWRRLGIGSALSASDLPIGQVAFGDDQGDGPGVVLATFDGPAVAFWRGLAGAETAEPGLSEHAAGTPLVDEAHRQLGLLLGRLAPQPPAPAAALLQDWSADPFGGALHFWARGADAGAAAAEMLKPVAAMDLFVCGEAWSHCQGWVEGALERSDALLARWFGAPLPATAASGGGMPQP